MGLDIYLRRYENFADSKKRENEAEKITEGLWKKHCGDKSYNDASESEIQAYRDESASVRQSLGLGEFGTDETTRTTIEYPHPSFPDHYFKIGYFRSSYNDGGINNVLRVALGEGNDLYTIFDRTRDDDYEFQPDWAAALERCSQIQSAYREKIKNGSYSCFDIAANPFSEHSLPSSEECAMRVFEKESDEKRAYLKEGEKYVYSNSNGHFWRNCSEEVVALVPGIGFMGKPCVYVIAKRSDENAVWYADALEIVAETCRFVLSQSDSDKYYLAWSG